MLAKKKKLSKKQIKEDKLVTTYYQAQKFYADNQSRILMIAGAVAAVVLLIFWYNSKVNQDNLAATSELSRVISLYSDGLYKDAIDGKPGTNVIGLKKIVEEYGGSEQGEVARIYLANAYYFLEQYKEALSEYDDYSGSNELLVASALAGKAACLEVQNKYAEAAEYYSKAANVFEYNPMNDEYLLKAGISYVQAGDNEKAKEMLSKVKADYKTNPSDPNAAQADKYLALIEGN